MSEIAENLAEVRGRIANAAKKAGRDASKIKLVAISKTRPALSIREAYAEGQRVFGESYAQELKEKAEELRDLEIEWHFVGHLQRNKVKYVTPSVKCIHSLDSLKLAEEIEKRAEHTIDCFIEVNLAGEALKTGIFPAELDGLVKAIAPLKRLNLIGLMTMPPYDPDPEKSRSCFAKLRTLMDETNKKGIYPQRLSELSMGMTGDMEVAILEGSTIVRIGTAIFGERRKD